MERKYHLFNASGKVLGRLATEIALVLSGKNKVDFTPNVDGGDFVVVINSDKVLVTGNKPEGKVYHHFSGYPGGITSINFKDQLKKDSTKLINSAVHGMLSKNKLRAKRLKRLFVYKNDQHGHKIEIEHK
ncbi:MAG: large subunit ribosomal protein L13 [Parcubacteria group bacterium Athens0714_25]|nr:MAG: large subunit ribosomal protein L13 [Parcubacteria group bacterium Athens0714_25]